MDFVVVGFGLGALGVLLGVVMLGWLAERWERAALRASSLDYAAHDLAVAEGRRAAGGVFIYAGGAVLLATVGGLAGSLDDRTGAFLVATTATVAVLGILLWGFLHHSRNPTSPLPGRRPRAVPVTGVGEGVAPAVAVPLALMDSPAMDLAAMFDGETIALADDALAADASTGLDDNAALVPPMANSESDPVEPGAVDEPAGSKGDG